MRVRVNHVLLAGALVALASPAMLARADEAAAPADSQWVPSLAVTSGVLVGDQAGRQSSFLFDGETGTTSPLRAPKSGSDRAVSPFVGGELEILTPALPFAPRVRFFGAAEVLPSFAPERQLAQEGQASRIRGPDVGAVLAGEEDSTHFTEGAPGQDTGPRPLTKAFGEAEANGQGMITSAQVDQLLFGAKAGISFSFEWRGRQMRIKPSIGWIHYKVDAKGYMVDPTCGDGPRGTTVCTDTYNPTTGAVTFDAVPFRESILSGHDSGTFDGVGPGLDLEMQTGRLGPLGTALFLGLHGYYQPGDRDIDFSTTIAYNDAFGNDTNTANWHVRVAPWVYRAGVGIRFQWLGSGN